MLKRAGFVGRQTIARPNLALVTPAVEILARSGALIISRSGAQIVGR